MSLTLYFDQDSDLELSLCFEHESIPKLNMDAVSSEIASYPGIQSLFNAAAKQLGNLDLLNGRTKGEQSTFVYAFSKTDFNSPVNRCSKSIS